MATLLVHLFSVAIGEALGLMIPTFWLTLAAGIAFIGFGVWTLRGDSLDGDETRRPRRFGPFVTVAIAFFLAELGDKTMLATVTLASQLQDAFPVWIGSTLGMVIADGLAVIVGLVVGQAPAGPGDQVRLGCRVHPVWSGDARGAGGVAVPRHLWIVACRVRGLKLTSAIVCGCATPGSPRSRASRRTGPTKAPSGRLAGQARCLHGRDD